MNMSVGEMFIEAGRFLLAHPKIAERVSDQTVNISTWDKERFLELAREFGACEKTDDGTHYILRKSFGGLVFDLYIVRSQICERVQIGEKEVPEQIIPAKAEEFIPAHTEPIYEWKCPESVLSRT